MNNTDWSWHSRRRHAAHPAKRPAGRAQGLIRALMLRQVGVTGAPVYQKLVQVTMTAAWTSQKETDDPQGWAPPAFSSYLSWLEATSAWGEQPLPLPRRRCRSKANGGKVMFHPHRQVLVWRNLLLATSLSSAVCSGGQMERGTAREGRRGSSWSAWEGGLLKLGPLIHK